MNTQKECSLCHELKQLEDFHNKHINNNSIHVSRCKECVNRTKREKYREKVKQRKIHGTKLENTLPKDQLEKLKQELLTSEKKTEISKRWNILYTDLINYYNLRVKVK